MLGKVIVLASVVAAALVACSSFTQSDPGPLADASTPDADDTGVAADGGIPDAPRGAADSGLLGCQGDASCERVVFITSKLMNGANVGGISGADALCNSLASGSTSLRVKGRTFRAWISTSGSSVANRLTHGTDAYVLPDDTTVASSWTDFASSLHMVPIDHDESGLAIMALDAGVWTGSTNAGIAEDYDCHNWAGSTGSGEMGLVSSDADWSASNTAGCVAEFHLYCIEY